MVIVNDKTVEFRFFRPEAKDVHVVGDFTGWRCGEIRMAQTREGYWKAQVRLPAGVFRFRYFADGQWFTDYAAFGVEYGPFGVDSVLRVLPQGEHGEEEPQRAVDARLGLPAPQAAGSRVQAMASVV